MEWTEQEIIKKVTAHQAMMFHRLCVLRPDLVGHLTELELEQLKRQLIPKYDIWGTKQRYGNHLPSSLNSRDS